MYNYHYRHCNNILSPDFLVALYSGVTFWWWDALKECLLSVLEPLINDNFVTIISRITGKYWNLPISKKKWMLPGKYEPLGIKESKTTTKDISRIFP